MALLVVLACLLAPPAWAADCLEVAAKRLEPGDSLRVTLVDGTRLAGRYAGIADGGLRFLERAGVESTVSRSIPLHSIKDLRFRDKARPAVIYAIAGFIAGAAVAASLHDAEQTYILPDLAHVGVALLGGVAGMAVGLSIPFGVHYNAVVECE